MKDRVFMLAAVEGDELTVDMSWSRPESRLARVRARERWGKASVLLTRDELRRVRDYLTELLDDETLW